MLMSRVRCILLHKVSNTWHGHKRRSCSSQSHVLFTPRQQCRVIKSVKHQHRHVTGGLVVAPRHQGQRAGNSLLHVQHTRKNRPLECFDVTLPSSGSGTQNAKVSAVIGRQITHQDQPGIFPERFARTHCSHTAADWSLILVTIRLDAEVQNH
ncbi:MAG: hypothetical protein Ct9H300mP25_14610 [Acidobacteriota bacterium]|nr:MAG: hypothetical protein Ct9H300mP25_14610 [Acidobacteriota bacterium]